MAKAKKEKPTTLKQKTTAKKTVGKKSFEKKLAPRRGATRRATRSIGITKEYLKAKNICRIKFTLPKVAAPDAKSVCIVGDFNNWNIHANPMKKLKNRDYTIKLDLETGREYQFRYFIDESKWENDWNADKYVKSPYGDSDNSVIIVDALD